MHQLFNNIFEKVFINFCRLARIVFSIYRAKRTVIIAAVDSFHFNGKKWGGVVDDKKFFAKFLTLSLPFLSSLPSNLLERIKSFGKGFPVKIGISYTSLKFSSLDNF